jgi:hypothetical protein
MTIKKITKNFYTLFILLFLASMLVYPASNPAENQKSNTEIVYRLPLENFFPEGMAYDPVDKCFYLGSLQKSRIVRIDMNGKYRDFIAPGQDSGPTCFQKVPKRPGFLNLI